MKPIDINSTRINKSIFHPLTIFLLPHFTTISSCCTDSLLTKQNDYANMLVQKQWPHDKRTRGQTMSYQDGWAAINLDMPRTIPRTEYSAEGHWALIKSVTGIDVSVDSADDRTKTVPSTMTPT